MQECLLVVLNEEWEHRLSAERDRAVQEGRTTEHLTREGDDR